MANRVLVPSFKPQRMSSGGGGAASFLGGAMKGMGRGSSRIVASDQKTDVMKQKNFMDQAIKIHNKKLDIVSKENSRRAQYGEPALPYPKFKDTLREDFGMEDSNAAPANAGGAGNVLGGQPAPQAVDNSAAMKMLGRNIAQNIPASNRGIRTNAVLDQLLKGMDPKPMVSDRLPSLQSMISALDGYDDPKTAIEELAQLDEKYLGMGLDIIQVEQNGSFVEAFRRKFGDQALASLEESFMMRREGR